MSNPACAASSAPTAAPRAGCRHFFRKNCSPLRIAAAAAICFLFLWGVAALTIPAVHNEIFKFFHWAERHKTQGEAIYTAVFAVGAIVCWPEIVLAASAGYLFGFPLAFASTYFGGLVASIVAFWVSRKLLRKWVVKNIVAVSPVMQEVDKAIARRGLALALLIRLPYVPFVQMNYVFGITPLTFRDYLIATAVGIIPGSALYAFVGTGIHNIEDYISGKESVGPLPMILSIAGIATAVIVFVSVAVYARRAVKRAAKESELDPLVQGEGPSHVAP